MAKVRAKFEDVYKRLVDSKIVGSRTELANLLGLGRAVVTYIANKRIIVPDEWERRFEDAGYSWRWVTTGDGPMFNAHAISAQGKLCVAKRIVADGKGFKLSERDVEIPFHTDYLHMIGISGCDAVNYFTVQGDAMMPTLAQGDICIVDTSVDTVDIGLYYLVQFANGILGVRKVVPSGADLLVTSDNESYEPVVYDEEKISVVGRVAGFLKKV